MAKLLLALIPTTSSWLLPVPALKLGKVTWNGEEETVVDVDWTLSSTSPDEPPPDEPVVALAVFDGLLVPTEFIAETR